MSSRTLSSQGASLTLHLLLLAALMLLARTTTTPGQNKTLLSGSIPNVTLYVPPSLIGGGGGGGDRSETPSSKGALPDFSPLPLAPPQAVIRNPDPELPVPPALLGAAVLVKVNLEPLGNPWGVVGPPSNGPGSGGGIGDKDGRGVGNVGGDGAGPGTRGSGVQVYGPNDGIVLPQIVYRVDPEFSDEARKARHQGVVRLRLVVGSDGLVHDPQVIQGLGLGLDERALEAVKQWRFRPGTKGGAPVAVEAAVEVTFRLL